jgi:hypothetical protein
MYAVREGELVTRTIMRSNNGPTLLAVNLFEFGLLAEVIATEVGVALGPLVHDVFSFHIYDPERERAEKAVAGWDEIKDQARAPMPPMPGTPGPLDQTRILARLETELTHDLDRLREAHPEDLLAQGMEELDDYWLAFYRVLMIHALGKTGRFRVARAIAEELPAYFRGDAFAHVEKQEEQAIAGGTGQLFIEPAVESGEAPANETEDATAQLRRICKEIEVETDLTVSLREYEQLEERFVTDALARRSSEEQFTRSDIEQALRELRNK